MAQSKNMTITMPERKHRNRFIVPMNKRCRAATFRHRGDRRPKDARKSWRREEW